MEKNLRSERPLPSDFLNRIRDYENAQFMPKKILFTIEHFFHSYVKAIEESGLDARNHIHIFFDYLDLIKKQIDHPFTFEPYHQMIRSPYDYHQFGIDFMKPLVHLDESTVNGLSNLEEIYEHIHKNHNVILLANHQIEADPQAICILLETVKKELIQHLIFVAGERVIIDPVAIPFSLGCNLLCIYSKRYIDYPPENKTLKQHHNNRTMKLMKTLLDEGGHCIYVAPSGGRDRPDQNGILKPAPFDPQSIEMFYLMARHAGKSTFFYPLALSTYHILPPPETIQQELGEHRKTQASDVHLNFGSKIDMENFPGSDLQDKHLRRKARAEYIYNLVCQGYDQFL
jgi:glycerol-3-phosphate O-acyltransferase